MNTKSSNRDMAIFHFNAVLVRKNSNAKMTQPAIMPLLEEESSKAIPAMLTTTVRTLLFVLMPSKKGTPATMHEAKPAVLSKLPVMKLFVPINAPCIDCPIPYNACIVHKMTMVLKRIGILLSFFLGKPFKPI